MPGPLSSTAADSDQAVALAAEREIRQRARAENQAAALADAPASRCAPMFKNAWII